MPTAQLRPSEIRMADAAKRKLAPVRRRRTARRSSEPHVDEAMVDVPPVRREERAAFEVAAHHGGQRVEDRDTEGEHRDEIDLRSMPCQRDPAAEVITRTNPSK